MKAYVFPGQGAQFSGMGKELYEKFDVARQMFKTANEVLGFNLTDIMFQGSEEDLKQTHVTQPAIFTHSVIAYCCREQQEQPDMVAGHSLGEFSALVANGTLAFEDALALVSTRAQAMRRACEQTPSGMAAILKFTDEEKIKAVCNSIQEEVVVAANFNCPGQVAISGSLRGLELATAALREVGATRVLPLKVDGAFHSPLMRYAQDELAEAINRTPFHTPSCPIYQNATALPSSNPEDIKQNLIAQLTSPVLWTKSVRNMIQDGATHFTEFGPGDVLKGLIKRIDKEVVTL